MRFPWSGNSAHAGEAMVTTAVRAATTAKERRSEVRIWILLSRSG
jgi:hypothetical protein